MPMTTYTDKRGNDDEKRTSMESILYRYTVCSDSVVIPND